MELYRELVETISLTPSASGVPIRTKAFNIRCFTDVIAQVFFDGNPTGTMSFQSRVAPTEQAWIDVGPEYTRAITQPDSEVIEYPDMLGAEACIHFTPNPGCTGHMTVYWLAKRR